MEEQKLTLREVITLTRDRLGDIDVPVKMKHIADGIWQAMGNLNVILEAMDREDAARREEKPETTGEE